MVRLTLVGRQKPKESNVEDWGKLTTTYNYDPTLIDGFTPRWIAQSTPEDGTVRLQLYFISCSFPLGGSPLHTPLLERRKCWGKSILPRAGYRLGAYSTVDIFNFSHFCWPILEKKRFLCFYIIKSIARKGYFGPKYP